MPRSIRNSQHSTTTAATNTISNNNNNNNNESASEDEQVAGEPTDAASTAIASKKKLKLGIGKRVFSNRSLVVKAGAGDEQRAALPEDSSRHFQIYGTILSGKSTEGYIVSFDIFPEGHKTLLLMPAKLTVVEHGTDEPTESDRAREKRLVICMHFFIFLCMRL